tara:strand:- start:1287 stop:1973 length:687 start_codon:yes stop_codon:yes gene_type:complete
MISFIIPAYNEEKYIKSCISSIQIASRNYEYETIVVNDNSSDKTKEIALKNGAVVIDVNYRHIGKVRNAGARSAKGNLLVFIDADTCILSTVLTEIVNNKNKYKAGCAFGKYYDLYSNKYCLFCMNLYTWVMKNLWRTGFGYFMWCNAKDFNKGFSEDLYIFEDKHFVRSFKSKEFYFGKQRVLTSGRKVRTHNFLNKLVPFFIKYCFKGKKLLKDKNELDIWYDGVR